MGGREEGGKKIKIEKEEEKGRKDEGEGRRRKRKEEEEIYVALMVELWCSWCSLSLENPKHARSKRKVEAIILAFVPVLLVKHSCVLKQICVGVLRNTSQLSPYQFS